MDIKQNLADNIALYRKSLKLTQAELGEKLNYSDKAVSKWERAEAVPEIVILKQLADFFGVTVDDLLKEPKTPKKPLINLNRKRLAIGLWSTCIVWLVAVISYVLIGIFFPSIDNSWLAFIVGIPVNLIVLLVLTKVWGKNLITFLIVTLLIWSLITALYLVLFYALYTLPQRLWYIFLIGIPLQGLLTFLFIHKSTNIVKK